MSTTKLYTVAGTSTFNGKTKVRFANDYVSRFKILTKNCLLYTSPSPRDVEESRMPSSA